MHHEFKSRLIQSPMDIIYRAILLLMDGIVDVMEVMALGDVEPVREVVGDVEQEIAEGDRVGDSRTVENGWRWCCSREFCLDAVEAGAWGE